MAAALLERAGLDWRQIDRLAAGVGPGGYTGLRIGLATARGIAQSSGAELVGVGTLQALAEPVTGRAAAAVLDARRGEAFVAVYRDGEELLPPRTCRPEEIAGLALAGGPQTLAIGDGAQRYRESIERGGIEVAPAASGLHRLSAAAICRLAAAGNFGPANPDYLRLADAEMALAHRLDERAGATCDSQARLRRPARRLRDRAARLPDPVVDRDVRARAVQADRALPRGAARRCASSVTRSARATTPSGSDERRRRPRPAPSGHRLGAARRALRARRRQDAQFTLEVRRSNQAAIELYQRDGFRIAACAGAITRTTARTR